MKYLTKYKVLEHRSSWVKVKYFIDKINWEIFEDIRNLADDELDSGSYIAYKVQLDDIFNSIIAFGLYDNIGDIKKTSVFPGRSVENKDYNLTYKFVIIDKENKRVFQANSTKNEEDVLNRLKKIYPNEKIKIGQ